MRRIFLSAIGTDAGKTIASAVLCKALNADYWKPVQAGDLDRTDSTKIRSLVPEITIHPEQWTLNTPASPHAASAIDGIYIDLNELRVPSTKNTLIVEGAGGLMVPVNEQQLMIDIPARINAEVVLVSRHYLGSINHTLLSAEALKQRKLKVTGIIFNGDPDHFTESAILKYTGLRLLGRLPLAKEINTQYISLHAEQFSTI